MRPSDFRSDTVTVPTPAMRAAMVDAEVGDDVLDGDQTMTCAHAIGPSRTLVALTYARHDVFVSADREVTLSALAHLETWLIANRMTTNRPAEGGAAL